jgi:hypothetical protein
MQELSRDNVKSQYRGAIAASIIPTLIYSKKKFMREGENATSCCFFNFFLRGSFAVRD